MASDTPAMTPAEQREFVVVSRLHLLLLVAGVLGTVMLALSFIPLKIWDTRDSYHVEPAMDWTHRLWVVVALLPRAWLTNRATRRRVLLSAVWFIATCAVLELYTGAMPVNRSALVDPWWVQPVLGGLFLVIAFVMVVIMPLIRLFNRELPGLPEARIHRRA